jgi:hypothetical protein
MRRDVSIHTSHGEKRSACDNVLAHGYDIVEYADIWDTVRNSLPPLIRQVQALLGEGVSGPPLALRSGLLSMRRRGVRLRPIPAGRGGSVVM